MRPFGRGGAAKYALLLMVYVPQAANAQDTPTPPPLPPTTPTESHATVTTATPSSNALLGTVLPPEPPLGRRRPGSANPGLLTPGATPADAKNLLDYVSDGEEYSAITDTAALIGNVRLRYNGYTVTCDRATYDRAHKLLTFENNVVLTTAQQVVLADFVRLDTRTNEFVARGGRTVIPPELIGQQITEAVRISGETVSREGNLLIAERGLLTTCDFPAPHFKIGFAKATIIPKQRIVLRKAVLYRYDKPVLRLDYLALPIHDQIQYSYLPVVGKNDEEGYFVKNAVGYVLGNSLPGILRIDYLSRKGTGLGFDQAYKFGEAAAGTAILYGLQDKSRGGSVFNGRINHQQRIGDTLAALSTDFQNNSYNALVPNSRSQNTSLTTTRNATFGTTTATVSVADNNNGGYTGLNGSKSRNYQYGLTQTARIGQTTNLTFRFNGNDSSQTSSATDALSQITTSTSGSLQQTGDLRATGKLGPVFDFDLGANKVLASRRTGVGGGSGYYSGTQSLPALTLNTDTSRLTAAGPVFSLLSGLFAAVPTRFSLGYGRYLTSTNTSSQSQRALFDAQTNARAIPLTRGGALSLTLNGDFRQTAYKADFTRQVTDSTGTAATSTIHNADFAQYTLRGDGGLTQRLGQTSAFNLTYNYLRPYGGTPQSFLSDQTGSANALGANLNIDGPRVRFTLRSGYDIQEAQREIQGDSAFVQKRNPWQQLTSSLAFKPDNVLQSRFETSYNINTGRLLTATNRTRLRGQNDFALDFTLQYDPQKHRFPQITETLSTPVFSRDLRLTALASYNDVTHQFDYKNFGLIQSFHDYEYVLSFRDQSYGFRSDKGVNFFIRLKAFPFVQTPATGRFGTAIETGTGNVF